MSLDLVFTCKAGLHWREAGAPRAVWLGKDIYSGHVKGAQSIQKQEHTRVLPVEWKLHTVLRADAMEQVAILPGKRGEAAIILASSSTHCLSLSISTFVSFVRWAMTFLFRCSVSHPLMNGR